MAKLALLCYVPAMRWGKLGCVEVTRLLPSTSTLTRVCNSGMPIAEFDLPDVNWVAVSPCRTARPNSGPGSLIEA